LHEQYGSLKKRKSFGGGGKKNGVTTFFASDLYLHLEAAGQARTHKEKGDLLKAERELNDSKGENTERPPPTRIF